MNTNLSRAKESRAAIQRINTAMRHLFIRGHYKPLGASGDSLSFTRKDNPVSGKLIFYCHFIAKNEIHHKMKKVLCWFRY